MTEKKNLQGSFFYGKKTGMPLKQGVPRLLIL
jgi:hypothetical protein